MSWTRLVRVAPPVGEVVTIAEARANLRVDGNDEDRRVKALIDAAVSSIEGPRGVGIALLTQTWRLSLDGFPVLRSGFGALSQPIPVPLRPVQSIESIAYLGQDGQPHTLDPADVTADLDADPATISPAWGKSWPLAHPGSGTVRITFVAGFGDMAPDVPGDLRQAVHMLVATWYENRETVTAGRTELPDSVGLNAILRRYRAGRSV